MSLVSFSVLLNLFLSYFFVFGGCDLTWSRESAKDAEAAASVYCSGHGEAFVDGPLDEQGRHVCECHACYGGPDCSEFQSGCPADVNSGDPLFLEPFWRQHEASGSITEVAWHRMSYSMNEGNLISVELERQIRRLHSVVGNANTTGRYIVFGVGSMQLLGAAVSALSAKSSTPPPARVVASVPYYGAYRTQSTTFKGRDYEWSGDASRWRNSSDQSVNFIEFVTSPNNPDGQPKESILKHLVQVDTIHDHAYYWPQFTAIQGPADEDLMLFSLSKLTGHAGSRFGWALIKDKDVYERMLSYVRINTLGVSRDTQLRALRLIRAALKGEGRELFEFGYKTMRKRWVELSAALAPSGRFSLQKIAPRHCSYFKEVTGPSPGYAWLKCEHEEDEDCYAVLRAAGIIGREGSEFEAESRYVRLSLLKSGDVFDVLLRRIQELVGEKDTV
ncbi:tryptophan aminotransferase-related protein 3-like [Aristolochia californica]|uniref:tryptophan aminotransferase-related protein 3-like n=1 Tax=Aristolochia californica TaxID=171875 RepID=UPI0035E2B75C